MAFKFLGGGSEWLDRVEQKVRTMFAHDRREFDLALSALLGEVPAGAVNAELRSLDQAVNRLEREIRRELVVHASVHGAIDSPAVLVYMSVVKDIERLGDYAKNLLDLARDGADFSTLAGADDWRRLRAEISQLIADAGETFLARDVERARQLAASGGGYLAHFDERVSALVRGEGDPAQPVARALAYRYLKRVVAHLMNVLSAVLMPIDKLDYYDEDPEDR